VLADEIILLPLVKLKKTDFTILDEADEIILL